MKKVLLLNPPGDKLYLRDQHCSSTSKASYYWPPVDLLMQSGILSEGNEVTVIDAIIEKMDEESCLNRIKLHSPDFILFVTGVVSWVKDLSFMKRVKEETGAGMAASGGMLLSEYREIMERYEFLDIILMDFSSDCLSVFLKGEEPSYDVCMRKDNEIVLKPYRKLKEFSIPVPRHELFPLKKYRLPHNRLSPFSSVMTNYGCPFNCSFCIAQKVDFKYRPVENVMEELKFLVSIGVREVFIKDFTFGIPRAAAEELCRRIKEELPGLSWICESRVNVMDEGILAAMKEAGCHTIQFGVESASQELLDSSDKGITVEQIRSVFQACRRLGIRTLAHFILGLPGETEDSLMDTIKLAKEIKCDYASFNMATPTPGTSLREKCIENNWLGDDSEELDSSLDFPVINTPMLPRERLWYLRNYALKSFYLDPSYIIRKLFSIKSANELITLFREGFSMLATIRR